MINGNVEEKNSPNWLPQAMPLDFKVLGDRQHFTEPISEGWHVFRENIPRG